MKLFINEPIFKTSKKKLNLAFFRTNSVKEVFQNEEAKGIFPEMAKI